MTFDKELDNMIEKFPAHRARIIHLYYNNLNFKSICDDYWISAQMLSVHRKNLMSDLKLTEEYKSICVLLENEALNYLSDNPR